MDQQWTSYADRSQSNRLSRYAPQTLATQQPLHRDQNFSAATKQDHYQSPAIASHAATTSLSTPSGAQGRGMDHNGDGDGDIPMEDADPFSKPKHSARPDHQRISSTQFVQQEESAAARRYSPMNLSPSSPYAASPQQLGPTSYASYTPQTQSRQSPTRSQSYMSPTQSYYASSGQLRSMYTL